MEKITARNISFVLVLSLILCLSFYLVFAADADPGYTITVLSPLNMSNQSGIITLSVSLEAAAGNVTFYWVNGTGEGYSYNTSILNLTSNGSGSFANNSFNTSIITTLYNDGIYNLNISVYNLTDVNTQATNISYTITLDNNLPLVFLNMTNNTKFNTLTPTINFSAGDHTFATLNCSVFVDNVLVISNSSVKNYTGNGYTNITLPTLSQGNHSYYVWCNDSAYNTNASANLSLTVDTIAPVITINTPSSGSNLSTGIQLFNVTFNEATLYIGNVTFNLTNESASAATNFWNLSFVSSNSGTTWYFWNNTVLTHLQEGRYNLSIFVNDTFNNANTTNISFTVDRTNPIVQFINVSFNFSSNTNRNKPSVTFNYTDVFSVSSTCILYLNNTPYNTSTVNNNTNTVLIVNATLADGSYNITVNCTDGSSNTGNTSVAINMNVDGNPPLVSLFNTPGNRSFNRLNFTLNVTVNDSTIRSVQYFLINGSNESHYILERQNLSQHGADFWNTTFDITRVPDGNYTFKINATDWLYNMNFTQTMTIIVDDSQPDISSFTCSNIDAGAAQSCTCTAVDNSQAFGGSVSTSIEVVDTSTTGTKSVTCTATDSAGNTDTDTTTYQVSSSGSTGSSSGGSSGGISSSIQGQTEKKIWTSINQGETASVSIKNGELGVTSVQFKADKTMWGPWIEVAKKDSLPSGTSSLGSNVYRYIEISKGTSLPDGSYSNVVIDFKVTKAWLAEKKLGKTSVVMFHFKDNKWTELITNYAKEDDTYVHYTATTTGFSYFAIAPKTEAVTTAATTVTSTTTNTSSTTVVPPATTASKPAVAANTTTTTTKSSSSSWLYIVLGLIIVVLAVVLIRYFKNRR